MKIHSTNLPKTERFVCTKRNIKEIFQESELGWVGFGWPYKHFTFDSRCRHRPKIRGTIVATLTVSRQRESYLILYAIRRDIYPNQTQIKFQSILHKMKLWLQSQLAQPSTAILGYEELLIEWYENTHHHHQIRYL